MDERDLSDHGYRNDLAAAHERIAELEALLAEKLGEKPEPLSAQIERLEDERVWILGTAQQARTRGFLVATACAILGGILVANAALGLVTVAPLVVYATVLAGVALFSRRGRAERHRETMARVARVEERVATLKRSADEMAGGPAAKVRVEASLLPDERAIDAEFPEEEPLAAQRQQS